MIIIPVGIAESLVVALVTHGTRVELFLDVLGGLLVLTLIGLVAQYAVYPHVVSADGVRIRHLGRSELFVPMTSISSVQGVSLTGLPSGAKEPDLFDVPVKGRVNVVLDLASPQAVPGQGGQVGTIRFAADSPDAVAQIRIRLGAARSQG